MEKNSISAIAISRWRGGTNLEFIRKNLGFALLAILIMVSQSAAQTPLINPNVILTPGVPVPLSSLFTLELTTSVPSWYVGISFPCGAPDPFVSVTGDAPTSCPTSTSTIYSFVKGTDVYYQDLGLPPGGGEWSAFDSGAVTVSSSFAGTSITLQVVLQKQTLTGGQCGDYRCFVRTNEYIGLATFNVGPPTVSVEFFGRSDSSKFDSGFDRTNVDSPSGSLGLAGPAWVSVAVGQTTTIATARIPADLKPMDIRFQSDTPAAVIVNPTQGTSSSTQLSLTGFAPGRAEIRALLGNTIVGRLKVIVYEQKLYHATASTIAMKECPPPATNVSPAILENQLNMIFDVAALSYRLGKQAKTLNVKPAGTDCILDIIDPITGSISAELDAVDQKAWIIRRR